MLRGHFSLFPGAGEKQWRFPSHFQRILGCKSKKKEVIALFLSTQVNMEVVPLFNIHIQSKSDTHSGCSRGDPALRPGTSWQYGFWLHWKLGWVPGWWGSFAGKRNVLREIASGLDLVVGCCYSKFLQEALPCWLAQGPAWHLQLPCPGWPALVRRLHAAEALPSYLLCPPKVSHLHDRTKPTLCVCAGVHIYMCVWVCMCAFGGCCFS